MNINLVTNTDYVMLWAITSIESTHARILNAIFYKKIALEGNKFVT